MLKTYTHTEMLSIWREKLGFDISRNDCTIEQFELLDVNSIIARRMRLWYLGLLDSASPALLPLKSISPTVRLHESYVSISLPDNCRRITMVSVGGWLADIKTDDAYIPRIASDYMNPHAVIVGKTLLVGLCYSSETLKIEAILDPGENSYILDEFLLSTIPERL